MESGSITLRALDTGVAASAGDQTEANADWHGVVREYQRSDTFRSVMQVVTTLVPLGGMLWLMYQSLVLPYFVTLLLALPTAGLLIRTFIIMHDCGHGSFFSNRRANELLGWFTGVLVLTPYAQWRHDHSLHHASAGDLDRRGHGDVETMTVREFQALTPKEQSRYRMMRNPYIMFLIGPIHFMIKNRFKKQGPMATERGARSVVATNVAIVALIAGATLLFGWQAFVLVYLPAMYLAAAGGILLFYVQHQFEETYWKDHPEWDYATAAIRGSSHLVLPKVLQWFTGSIGLHHVHHLGPRIPNYRLQRCHDENPLFHDVTTITLKESLRTLHFALWDEEQQRMISFRELAQR